MAATLEGSLSVGQSVASFAKAEALIRALFPTAERIWIDQVSVAHYDVSIFGDALPAYAAGPSVIRFKAAARLEDC